MNPYASPYRRAVISAYLRRANGEDYNPALSARIATRYTRVLAYSNAVWFDGTPARSSQWKRRLTGNVWRVVESAPGRVRIQLPETSELEFYEVAKFLELFEPVP